MPLPMIPNVPTVGPGGRIFDAFSAITNQANKLTQSQLENKKKELENQYYAPEMESNIAYKNALTGKIPLENQLTQQDILKQQILNKYLPESEKARISNLNALANNRQLSGPSGLGVQGQEELRYQNAIKRDNPQLKTPEQIYEATNALSLGKSSLADGTPLNPLSPAARRSLDRLTKGTTSSSVLTQLLNASQADSELGVLSKYALKGLEPYGETYFDMSPKQVLDTFKNDNKTQEQLGDFIAAQQLTNDIAQAQNRIAMGQPGITQTDELIKLSKQQINANYPHLSFAARKRANETLNEAFREGLKARKAIGVGASAVLPNLAGGNVDMTNPAVGEAVRQNVRTSNAPPPMPHAKWGRDSNGNPIRIS